MTVQSLKMEKSGFLPLKVDLNWAMDNNILSFSPLSVNPLSPNINKQILQTDLHTFPLRISWENLITDQGIFSLVIIC